jgi:N-acetylneuraminic acid mutarotase
MPHPRFAVAVAAGHDGRIYAIGGIDPAFNVYGEVDAYDPASNAWTPVAPLPGPRWDAAAAVGLDGTIYAIGGYGGPGQGSQVASAVAYDPLTNQWTTLAPLPQGLAETGATTAPDGRIYVAGGQIFKPATRKLAATNLVEVFNPATGGWKSGPKLPYRRDEHAFVTSGSQLLLIGGAGVRRDPVDTLALRP